MLNEELVENRGRCSTHGCKLVTGFLTDREGSVWGYCDQHKTRWFCGVDRFPGWPKPQPTAADLVRVGQFKIIEPLVENFWTTNPARRGRSY